MYISSGKLKRLKKELKIFNQHHFGNISIRVSDLRKKLAASQPDLITLATFQLEFLVSEQVKELSKELNDLLLAEESFYKQKSRVQWIKHGD
ncbi:hypothetical protein DITRI_Ditri04bG0079100 [Diplodiscus trichospermus]